MFAGLSEVVADGGNLEHDPFEGPVVSYYLKEYTVILIYFQILFI